MSNNRRDRVVFPRAGSFTDKGGATPNDYAQRMLRSEKLAELIQRHRELELQLRAFTEQANELRRISRAAKGATLSFKA